MDKGQTPTPSKQIQASPQAQVHAKPPAGKAAHPKAVEAIDDIAAIEAGEKANILKPGILLRTAILVVINLVAIAAIVFLLGRLETKAQEVKRLRSIQLGATKGEPFSALKSDVEAAEAKIEELAKYFPDSQGLITFVGEIDKLKADGVVSNFSFANEVPVKDKTGSLGLPVLIEFTGSWAQVDQALGRIMSLDYLVRAIRAEAALSQTEPGLINLKFGGFLYVDKNFSQD